MSTVGSLSVEITADAAKFHDEMGKVKGASGLGGLGVAAAAAVAAAGAAIVGFGAKSLAEFGEFDTGMREVFTLLPGITAEAMDEMEAEVIAFSNEFGKLPSEVIPALYSSLSAGVPPENVFEFMETATKLAVGGVTDLNTAVDGLTSIVNAYGEETITAAEASDFMFTAVRLGKTTVEELSGVIGRVTPIAASMGVGFDEVAAAIAAMTAQGLSTDEAGTALRSMLTDLQRGAGEVSNVFMHVAGTTFPEFIASGGDLESALEMLAAGADDLGFDMTDVFGNIRSALAATVLSSETGQEAMNANMAAMADSAGATDDAFEMMDAGISASWDRLTTRFNTLMIEVGDELAPMFQKAVDFIVSDVMPKLRDFVIGVFQAIAEITEWLTGVWEQYQTDTDGTFATVRRTLESAGTAIAAVFNALAALWTEVLKPTWDAIQPFMEVLFAALGTIISTGLEVITGVLNALAAFLRGDFVGAWNHMRDMVDNVTQNLRNLLETAWTALFEAAQTQWSAIRDAITGPIQQAWDWLTDTWRAITRDASEGWERVKGAITAPIQAARDWLTSTWEAIQRWLSDAWLGLASLARDSWEGIDAEIRAPIQAVWDWLVATWEAIKEWLGDLWGGIGEFASVAFGTVRENIMNAFTGLGEFIHGVFAGVVDVIGGMIDAIVARIQAAWDSVRALGEAVSAAASSAAETARSWRDTANEIGESWAPEWMQNLPGVRRDSGDAGSRALGGIVTRPMRALIGEAGAEAIMPLDRLDQLLNTHGNGAGGDMTVYIELDGRTIATAVAPRMIDQVRLKTGLSGAL